MKRKAYRFSKYEHFKAKVFVSSAHKNRGRHVREVVRVEAPKTPLGTARAEAPGLSEARGKRTEHYTL